MLCIVGGGKMGRAIASGILQTSDHDDVTIVDPRANRHPQLHEWIRDNGFRRVTVSDRAVVSEGAIIAVKAKDMEFAVSDAVSNGARRIISVAAGIPLGRLHVWAGHGVPVIRAMPNIGATVGQAAIAITGGTAVREDDIVWAEKLLSTTGTVVRVSEDQMDAVTGLSGSGPAYIFLVAEAMIEAGINAGLPATTATQLTIATIAGSAELLSAEGKSASELRGLVTTPAGTTAAGLRVLEQRALRAAFIDAVDAAAARSREIGQ